MGRGETGRLLQHEEANGLRSYGMAMAMADAGGGGEGPTTEGVAGGGRGVTNLSAGFMVLKLWGRRELTEALRWRGDCSVGTQSVLTR